MVNLDDQYAPEKRGEAIVAYESGTLVALAGPGTGKTYSLRKRARDLVVNRGIDAGSVAYITFIRAITTELENDLREEFTGEDCQPDIRVSTLHGLALGLIRNKGAAIGMVGHHEPLKMDSDQDLLVRQLHDDIRSRTRLGNGGAKLQEIRSALAGAKSQWQQGVGEPELSQKNINLRILRGLDVPVPPVSLQREFANIVHRFERLRAQQREAERHAEHLFQALLHQAFRGELG